MRRLAKIIGFVGGAVAIVWAMRDRFISVATSREPLPPTFRSQQPRPLKTETATPDSTVDTIDGIGPVYAARLTDAGLATVNALAKSNPDSVAEAAGVSAARARTWIDLAKQH